MPHSSGHLHDHRSWDSCLQSLQESLPQQQYNTWIKPLEASESDIDGTLILDLLAPNRFIRDWVNEKFLDRIEQAIRATSGERSLRINVGVLNTEQLQQSSGAQPRALRDNSYRQNSEQAWLNLQSANAAQHDRAQPALRHKAAETAVREVAATPQGGSGMFSNKPRHAPRNNAGAAQSQPRGELKPKSQAQHNNLIGGYQFDNFIEGKSNQFALATARSIVENPGSSYNPMFLYGGVGLGKTHLMHAIGNELQRRRPGAKIVYLHAERFVADMVKALQLNAINDFKRFYRSVDALLIDDIQFFAKKERSQEEFFHTFNALLEGGQQMILTCDRPAKEVEGVDERLQSRFSWGLMVGIDPPELETRAAILMRKAEQARLPIPQEVAFFMAQRVRSNVRELEGALKRVIASANFLQKPITEELVRESLKDLLALHDKQVSIDNIQRTIADYYNIKVADLMGKRRNRSVARPRQMAMALAKELTNHSLPEIGDAFGGRDHTTVLHACRKIASLREESNDIREDYRKLHRTLAT